MDNFEDNLLLFLAATQVFELGLYKWRKKKTKCWILLEYIIRIIQITYLHQTSNIYCQCNIHLAIGKLFKKTFN